MKHQVNFPEAYTLSQDVRPFNKPLVYSNEPAPNEYYPNAEFGMKKDPIYSI